MSLQPINVVPVVESGLSIGQSGRIISKWSFRWNSLKFDGNRISLTFASFSGIFGQNRRNVAKSVNFDIETSPKN